ncbi:MAG TPA: hypothetical protein VMS17_04450 [Gemmataceae bacterium]|nr:hypothetical protein [Gemmataceae bacterium]
MNARIWDLKKQWLRQELKDAALHSPVLQIVWEQDHGDEYRAVVRLHTETLVRSPGGAVVRAGPVVLGIRYHRRFLAEAPIPWEIVTVLAPALPFHPNINMAGALCLGHPPPGVSLTQVLHTAWAAVTFNMRLVNTVEWQGLNAEAAAYVRAHKEEFPLTPRGLFEAAPSDAPEAEK